MTKTAVVILNWNGKKFLEKFLPFVVKYSKDDADIIIADNASSDDSLAFMQENYPEIQIIKNSENGGFSKGYNDALSQIKAQYYVLLNSDIEVTENWIKPIISLMESDDNIAVCQPKLRSYFERDKFEYAGAAGGFVDKYGYPFCRGRLFQTIETDFGQYNDTCEVFWATGAAMFVRAELYHKYGGLDNDFFAHMEEIDFCWRLKNEGYKIMYSSESTVFHVGGGTLPKNNSRKTYLNFRNNFFLLFKNLPSERLINVFICRLFLDFIAGFKFLSEGGINDFLAVIHAHLSFYSAIKKNLKKRENIHHKHVTNIYEHNIVWEYYIKKKKSFSELKNEDFS
ncbi:MAG: glycosyltransferase family 2 protein [Bacteroidales bacterium]